MGPKVKQAQNTTWIWLRTRLIGDTPTSRTKQFLLGLWVVYALLAWLLVFLGGFYPADVADYMARQVAPDLDTSEGF